MNIYIYMYNYSLELTYREIDGANGDTKYREEFLSVFGLTKWEGDKIEESFDYIYPVIECELKKHGLIKYAQNNSPFPFGLNDKTSLVLFFSFDSFFYFHKCLQDFSNNGSFSSANIEQLKKSLQKKNM